MRIKITSMLAAGLLSLPLVALAADATPKMGSSKDTVRSQFGAPLKQIPGVGTPAISRWKYQDFTVYFEDGRALHTVRHATALAQPPVAAPTHAAPTQAPAESLPAIEEINGEAGTAPAAASTPVANAPTEQPAGGAESTFRFDPVSGRIMEMGADGKPIASPTAQPAPAAPAPAPAPAPAAQPAPAAAPAAKAPTEQPAGETQSAFRFDPVSGRIVEMGADGKPAPSAAAQPAPAAAPKAAPVEAAAPAPTANAKAEAIDKEKAAAAAAASEAKSAAKAPVAPAPTPAAPAAETGQPPQFRFDPVSGRIVVDNPAAKAAPEQPKAAQPKAAPAPEAKAAPSEAAKQPAQESKPEAKTETKEPESGGFSVDWGA